MGLGATIIYNYSALNLMNLRIQINGNIKENEIVVINLHFFKQIIQLHKEN